MSRFKMYQYMGHKHRIFMKGVVLLFALGLVLLYKYYLIYDFVYIETDKGTLRGLKITTWRGVPYFSFKGIPYAKPPLGELRFKSPQEEEPWVGIRDSLVHGNVCPQWETLVPGYRGQEDCLVLNVYTPVLGADRMAVMVWIHGGIFVLSSGSEELYGPDYFMEAGVVLVSINYRLGALGFLSTGDDGAPGNAGLKDQVAALRWVRRNIAKFGGDPDNVTIFGGSSGAACVQLHILSPMSAGIGHSGSSLSSLTVTENGPAISVRLAESLGAKDINGDPAKALEFLKDVPCEDIVMMQSAIKTAEEDIMRIPALFSATVEKGTQLEKAFLQDRPLDILKSGNFKTVPYLTGYCSHEGYFYGKELSDPESYKIAFEDIDHFIPLDIKNEEFRKDLVKSIRTFYFNDTPITTETVNNFVDFISDTTFVSAINRAAKLQVQHNNAAVYFYVFSYDGEKNIMKSFFGTQLPGASHGDELGYLFHQNLYYWKKPAIGSDDEHVLNTMIRLWTNFAKYGNPTPAGDPLSWKPMTLDEFNYLNISGRDTKMSVNPDFERANFWEKAYEKYESMQH